MAKGHFSGSYEEAVAAVRRLGWTPLFSRSDYRGVAHRLNVRCSCGADTTFRLQRIPSTGRCGSCRSEPKNSRRVATRDGEFPSANAAARHYGINPGSLISRLRMGWTDEEACGLVPRRINIDSRDPSAVGFIYRIRNTVNGMVYIGLTSVSPERRWKGHLRSVRTGSTAPLHEAIRQFGADAFELKTLKESTVAELPELERRAMKRYKSEDPAFGYNGCPGGGLGGPMMGHAVNFNGETFVSRRAFADHIGVNYELVRKMFAEGMTPDKIAESGTKRSGTGSHMRKPVTIGGVTYPSKKDACRAIGVQLHVVNWRLRNGWSLEDAFNPNHFTRATSPRE